MGKAIEKGATETGKKIVLDDGEEMSVVIADDIEAYARAGRYLATDEFLKRLAALL